jgi:branched-subunit amino acid transport protein AzlD
MFPTGSEFKTLYITYFVMFVFLIFNLLKSEKKVFYKWNFLIFGIYLTLMIYVFSNSENFRYGNSLVVLFYGGIFVLLHFIIIVIIFSIFVN